MRSIRTDFSHKFRFIGDTHTLTQNHESLFFIYIGHCGVFGRVYCRTDKLVRPIIL